MVFWQGDFFHPPDAHKSTQKIFFLSSYMMFFYIFFLFNCQTASLKLILQLIFSSMMEAQKVEQPFLKLCPRNVCSLSSQFYCRLVYISEEKSYCISILISLLMFLRKIPKQHFSKGNQDSNNVRLLCHYTIVQGRGEFKPNRMVVCDDEGG